MARNISSTKTILAAVSLVFISAKCELFVARETFAFLCDKQFQPGEVSSLELFSVKIERTVCSIVD